MENSIQQPNPIFNEAFFKKIGFKYQPDCPFAYTKDIATHKLEFLVGEIDPEIGTYMAFKEDGKLRLTGYWHDEVDFNTYFNL